jgi:Protein of unknown function (DUF3370)
MVSFLLAGALILAQTAPKPQEIVRPQAVRALPGQLDDVPVFNSNSPEQVLNAGILLSTFPPAGKATPSAHLNRSFNGRFDVFTHHISGDAKGTDLRTLYLGVIVHNPGQTPVTIDTLQAASYLSQPDAPFIPLPAMVDNPEGKVYAGPGSRAADDLLRGKRQEQFPPLLVIPPGESRMLVNLAVPIKTLTPPLNGRSTMMRLRSTGPVYLASLAMFAPDRINILGKTVEGVPSLEEWQTLLQTSALATPRDKVPTPIGQKTGALIYGRVAGVAQGAQWKATVTDPGSTQLTIPAAGAVVSYGLATLHRGTLGTGQNQSAQMLQRYPDTAYEAHGNYAIAYHLSLPLVNGSDRPQTVSLMLESPLKREDPKGLHFYDSLPKAVSFRGTVRLTYTDDQGAPVVRYVHLVQRFGQAGEPLATVTLPAGGRRLVKFELVYPPDATPPQVLTVKTQ